MIRRMAVLSNLRRSLLPSLGLGLALALALSLALPGCAGFHAPGFNAPGFSAPERAAARSHLADRRLVPPDLVWTLHDGARMPVRVWLPRSGAVRAVILALHGMNDSRDAWELSGPALAEHGIAVYAPDQRGFGAAPGRGVWPGAGRLVDDAAEMTRLAGGTHPGATLFVMGESMGGAVAMCLAARPDHPAIAGTVLLAPAVWSSTQIGPLLTASLWTAATIAPNWKLTGRNLPIQVQPSDNIAALYRLSYDPLTLTATRASALRGLVALMTRAAIAAAHVHGRVLVAYGAHDQLVPPQATAASWERLPAGVRRGYYARGYHLLMRDRDRDQVIGDVASWILTPDRALPSGSEVAASAWFAGRPWQTQVPLLLPAGLDDLAGDD